jgi:hypothetical protein
MASRPNTPHGEPYIEVRANKLGQLGNAEWYHLYAVYHDGKGNECFLRGGPSDRPATGLTGSLSEISGGASNSASVQSTQASTLGVSHGSGSNPVSASDKTPDGPFGSIKTETRWLDTSPGAKLPVDYHPDNNVYKSVVVARGPGCEQQFRTMCDEVAKIEATGTRYSPLGPNSNTTVTTALRNANIEPKLPEGVIAPGAEQHIDTSKVNRQQLQDVKGDGDHDAPVPPGHQAGQRRGLKQELAAGSGRGEAGQNKER